MTETRDKVITDLRNYMETCSEMLIDDDVPLSWSPALWSMRACLLRTVEYLERERGQAAPSLLPSGSA